MYGLKTLERINRETAEANRTIEKHERIDGQREGGRPVKLPSEPRRDFLVGHHGDIVIFTPLTTKAVQWAYVNIRNHLGREGIAYVVKKENAAAIEAAIHEQGFGVN